MLIGMADEIAQFAEVQVFQERTGPKIRVAVPQGSSLEITAKLIPVIDTTITGLTGCASCNSGVPIEIVEQPDLASVVRVDLATMRTI
jgi:hypothetical protein